MARTTPLGGNATKEQRAPRASRARAGGSTSQGSAGGTASGPSPTPPKLTPDERKLKEALSNMYTMLGGAVQVRGDMTGDIGLSTAGVNIHSRADEAADIWLELARQNPRVKSALIQFTQGSAVAGIIAMHGMMVVPVLAARGMVRPEFGAMALNGDAKMHWMQKSQEAAAAAAATNGTPGGVQ